ncbi:MAG: hypothetical protein AN484_00750 [Aphanizomenon flos-aquae WA102]|uniref:Uncharacterized protein n=1 Tax=Aphanizomenon flos-aquae WA102 TaxID=1710896 RepID=A0A1B7X854_APHFL|nr:MAG: hypothetical protein AN484_00750 [Aphanizomenon flos-aquae WA102]
MVKIEHNLKFITEVDETHPVGMQLINLEKEMQIAMLEGMLKELVGSKLGPILDEINAGGSYAILKVAE